MRGRDVEHGSGVNDTNPESGRRREQSERSQESAGSIVPGTPKMDERTRRASGGKKCITCFIY